MTTDALSLINPDSIIFSLESTTREDAFIEMIDHLIGKKIIPLELRKEILAALESRELTISTAIGRELAIPHAAIHNLPSVVRLLARSEKGIGKSATDGLPVRFFYVSLIPDDDYSTHLRTIAGISSFFREDANLNKLKSAAASQDLEKIFAAS